MKTFIEFFSAEFPPQPGESETVNPGLYGQLLAEFLADALPQHGYAVLLIGSEDWGWRINLENKDFPLWIGCGNVDGVHNGFICFVEPSRPQIRRFLKKIDTTETVERLAGVIYGILERSGKAEKLTWSDHRQL